MRILCDSGHRKVSVVRLNQESVFKRVNFRENISAFRLDNETVRFIHVSIEWGYTVKKHQ